MIAILDFDMGNLRSIQKGFERVGYEAIVTRDLTKIESASKLVIPGVGAFRDGMKNLERYHLIDLIRKAIESGKPVFGICLGMQLLFSESEEFGLTAGLGLIPGKVRRFPCDLKVPHMGWNTIHIKKQIPIFRHIQDGEYFYFVHSYYVETVQNDSIAAMTEYGGWFTSAVGQDNIFATQFHPEKSQSNGLSLLKNFAELE